MLHGDQPQPLVHRRIEANNRPLRGGAAPVLGGRRLHGKGRTIDRSLASSLVDGLAVEDCDFGGCFGLRLVLHDRRAGREGVTASAVATWLASWPRGTHAEGTATTGADVTARTRAAASVTASTSSTAGRHGSSTRSATLAAYAVLSRRAASAGP